MSMVFYDKALTDKIQAWIPEESHLMILKPEETAELFRNNADMKNDRPITLPLIALSRDTRIRFDNTNKNVRTYDGFKIQAYDKDNHPVILDKTQKLCVIPMTLTYQLDIYTQNLADACEYVRNFMFNFTNHPNVVIEIPYNNCKLKHESTVYVDNDVEDNSDIPMRRFPTQFTRYTMKLTIDNAYIFSAPIKENLKIASVTIDINDKDGDTIESYEAYNIKDKK